MTGAFLRVKRDIHYKAIEIEYLTDEEREERYLKVEIVKNY